jgi:hypothetical protein
MKSTPLGNISRWLLLGSALLVCQLMNGQEPPKDETDLWNLAVRNQDMFLHDIGPALKATGRVGRLYVRSKCLGVSEDLLLFPRIAVEPAGAKGKNGVAAIRETLADSGVIVTERRPGLIAMKMGEISEDLLRTRIHVIKLQPMERYNYQDAIAAIISTTEVQARMQELGMKVSARSIHYPISYPEPKLPHLPGTMTNVTMDEALDRVAQMFHGLLIYEECDGRGPTRLFSIHMHEM